MSKHRRVRMTRVDAERLLDTGVGGPEPLAALLAAATPSPASGDVAGERAALTHFRAAHRAPARPGRQRTALKTVIANSAAPKVALAAAAAVAATGGIAVAAVTGSLPGTHHHRHTKQHQSPSPTLAAGNSPAPGKSTSASTRKPAPEPSSSAATQPDAIGSALRLRCRFFQVAAREDPGTALGNPAFSVLVAAAHGRQNVADFCTTLIGPPWTHPTGLWPTPPRHPWPTSHPWPTDPNGPWPTEPRHHRPPDRRSHHRESHQTGPAPTPTDSQPPTTPPSPTSRPTWPGQP